MMSTTAAIDINLLLAATYVVNNSALGAAKTADPSQQTRYNSVPVLPSKSSNGSR